LIYPYLEEEKNQEKLFGVAYLTFQILFWVVEPIWYRNAFSFKVLELISC